MTILGKRAELVIVDDLYSPLVTKSNLQAYIDICGRDFSNLMDIQDAITKDMNGPPTDQRLVRTLVSEVVHPKTKRNAAQWKKEQKMRRK